MRLDDWLPDPMVRSHHRRRAHADPQALWRAAADLKLSETRRLGRLVRWRIPGVPPDQTFQGLLGDYPFCVLDEGDGWMLSGLAGRIWTLQRDYPRLDAQAPQVLAGRLRLRVTRRGGLVYAGESRLAGLEQGLGHTA